MKGKGQDRTWRGREAGPPFLPERGGGRLNTLFAEDITTEKEKPPPQVRGGGEWDGMSEWPLRETER